MNISATAFKGRLAFRRRIKRTTAALTSALKATLRPVVNYGIWAG
ncbi:hypothetical protein J2T10_003060 [Paenarthrobacter nicotinovorans]|uniref:Uncharacterized protein n=1 Tax=Paenarthrobacter nicotinovorans TaxID=29320 RepID=A0ABT9TPT8_PAENI|nr:hypothetical protein [Paenarthrobacter nicotinovorans]MDQ0103395.1 hypothetical protein [Paenarthrobacter nicotinovorans]GAT89860.1 hypothetical protein CVCC1112_4519 [Paenarthrobacter nicotinovorans]